MSKIRRQPTVPIYTGSSRSSTDEVKPARLDSKLVRRRRRRWAIASAASILVIILLLGYRASVLGPAFYRDRVAIDPTIAHSAGKEVEQSLARFHNDIRREGDWELILIDQSLNGWLATHLPKKFPGALPSQVAQPRTTLEDGRCRFAFQAKVFGIKAIVSADVEPFMTEEENVLAVRIIGARSGWLPLPISGWTQAFSSTANRAGFRVRWSQDQGDPLALITIPDEVPEFPELKLVVKSVLAKEGRLVIRGSTEVRKN